MTTLAIACFFVSWTETTSSNRLGPGAILGSCQRFYKKFVPHFEAPGFSVIPILQSVSRAKRLDIPAAQYL